MTLHTSMDLQGFTVVRGPAEIDIADGNEVTFQVENINPKSRESTVVGGCIYNLAKRSDGKFDLHLSDSSGRWCAWINNYDGASQQGGFGERV